MAFNLYCNGTPSVYDYESEDGKLQEYAGSVSYTHLDVYKRQGYLRPCRSSVQRRHFAEQRTGRYEVSYPQDTVRAEGPKTGAGTETGTGHSQDGASGFPYPYYSKGNKNRDHDTYQGKKSAVL